MTLLAISFVGTFWWIPLCLLVGVGYAWAMYYQSRKLPLLWQRLLAVARGLAVAIIVFLLWGPLMRLLSRTEEKPIVTMLVDHSASLLYAKDTTALYKEKENIKKLRDDIANLGYDVQTYTLAGKSDLEGGAKKFFSFDYTDLYGGLMRIVNDYENQNLGSIILYSDGIVNRGSQPDYYSYPTAIHCIGTGDTVPKKDIAIRQVFYNRLVFSGNSFPVNIRLGSYGFKGASVPVSITENGALVAQTTWVAGGDNETSELNIELTARGKGIRHYVVAVAPQAGEFTVANNYYHIYVEVLETKRKILAIAHSPHPDLKALRTVIETDPTRSLDVYIPGIHTPPTDLSSYDAVIMHQMPQSNAPDAALMQKITALPTWYIYGAQADLSAWGRANGLLAPKSLLRKTDPVTGKLSQDFSLFQTDNETDARLDKLPPLTAPYGELTATAAVQVLLKQKIGSVVTERPLWVYGESSGRKVSVLAAEGLWEWRLQEQALYTDAKVTDALIEKTLQYLTTGGDKRKFRVYTSAAEYGTADRVLFETEAYNAIYERVYGLEVTLDAINDKGEKFHFSYVTGQNSNITDAGQLPEGAYSYTASATIDGKKETAGGAFVVKSAQLEALETTARHDILRRLSANTGGRFVKADNMEALLTHLKDHPLPGTLHTQESLTEVIHLWWLFVVIVLLLSIEWFTRKYLGSY